jgi:membrane-bound ClpP family serine protease
MKRWFDLRIAYLLAALVMLAMAAMETPLTPPQMDALQIHTTNSLMSHAMNPAAAVLMFAGGWLLVCIEFCRPGTFVLGAAGALWMTLGGYAAVMRWRAGAGMAMTAPATTAGIITTILTAMLLRVAWQARRAKMRIGDSEQAPKVN